MKGKKNRSTSAKRGKKSPGANGKASRSRPTGTAAAALISGGDTILFDPGDLLDDDFQDKLAAACKENAGTLTVEVLDLLSWEDRPRWRLLSLAVESGRKLSLSFGAGAKHADNPLDAVLAIAEGPRDPMRCHRALTAAKEAAALAYPEAVGAAASTIVARFKDLGYKSLLPQSVAADIKKLVGGDAAKETATAQEAAHAFLANAQGAENSDHCLEPLLYFQDDFWSWGGMCWRRLADSDFRAKVVAFLQSDPRFVGMGERFVRDVNLHLQGLTHLDCRLETPPFRIERRDPPQIVSRPALVFHNGVIDIEDLLRDEEPPEVQQVDRSFFCESFFPYAFDADAECPLWERTIREVLAPLDENDRRIDVLQEFMGLTLIPGDTSFQKFMIAVGDGANGKSTLLNVWEALLGKDNVSHVPLDAFEEKFRLAQMRGKLANIAADMQHMDKVAEGRLKEFVAGDPVDVDRKHKDPIKMKPTARLIFATNVLPPFHDRTEGIWRRPIIMPYLRRFSGKGADRTREQRLLGELPGILNWALCGARRLYAAGRFTDCNICGQALMAHRYRSDPFRQFIDQEVVFGSEYGVLAKELYQLYSSWCRNNGRRPINSADFGERVEELPGVRLHPRGRSGKGKRLFSGLKFVGS